MPYTLILYAICILLNTPVCAQLLFQESSNSSGLKFFYKESLKMGGGAASFDFDNDGDEDIYVVGGQNPDGLFENDGTGNFSDISIASGIASLTNSVMSTSVITGDIDNDGIREIFIGTIGEIGTSFSNIKPNIILKYNDVLRKYEDITNDSKILDQSFCMGAHFFDSNLDGYLDIYLINYVANPKLILEGSTIIGFDHECYENKIYINNGDGTFEDRTTQLGLDQVACTLAATSSDLDWDGDPDLIVANDFGKWLEPNQLFENTGSESAYANKSQESNTNAQMYGMGIATGDFDEDLDIDFYITNIGRNILFENNGDLSFTDITESKNIQNNTTPNGLNTTGWGAIFEDFNNDSYLDLHVANGYVYSAVDIDDEEQNDELYLGSVDHTFTNKTIESGIEFYGPTRGTLKGDWNMDGQVDIITISNELINTNSQNSINYYKNIYSENNWVGFNLKGTTSNSDAFGSKVILYAEGRSLLREIKGGDSHASQGSSIAHFGLGNIENIDSITITWPSGLIETIKEPAINYYHKIEEGLSTDIAEVYKQSALIKVFPNPASSHVNIEFNDHDTEISRIKIFDTSGRLVVEEYYSELRYVIDISYLTPGLYNLVINTKENTISKTISIHH